MAAAFVAMNEIYGGNVFQVTPAEAREPELAQARAEGLAGQFIFDVQTHFVRDDFDHKQLLGLAEFASQHWNPKMKAEGVASLARYKFQNYVKEVFYDSDTSLALLSGAPFDDPTWWFLSNAQMAEARALINGFAGSRRLLAHALITPGQPGWMDEVDKAITVHKPDSWKGYTIGDPLNPSKFPWRLDDEKLVYPFYDKAVKAGITTICIHKGLLPPDYEKSYAGVWEYATAQDIGKAAKDWPQMKFVMYHACLRPAFELPDQAWTEFEQTGRIRWVSDLADIPQKFGVSNVYAELGTAFANSAVAHPEVLRRHDRHAGQGHGRRPCPVGHRFGVVRLAAVADRGDAPPRDPRGHAQEVRLRRTRRRQQHDQADDLREQRACDVRHQAEGRVQHQDAGLLRGPFRRAQAGAHAGGPGTLEPALRLRAGGLVHRPLMLRSPKGERLGEGLRLFSSPDLSACRGERILDCAPSALRSA